MNTRGHTTSMECYSHQSIPHNIFGVLLSSMNTRGHTTSLECYSHQWIPHNIFGELLSPIITTQHSIWSIHVYMHECRTLAASVLPASTQWTFWLECQANLVSAFKTRAYKPSYQGRWGGLQWIFSCLWISQKVLLLSDSVFFPGWNRSFALLCVGNGKNPCDDARRMCETEVHLHCNTLQHNTNTPLKMIGLFCKRALSKRLYSAKDTCNFKEPTNRSHTIICIQITAHTYRNTYILKV